MGYTKRKSVTPPDPVVPTEILERAKRSLKTDRLPPRKCSVCGADVAPNSAEGLCWVCRRLKISAWHESEQQMPAQE
ncbi:MAG: hypothetical protein LLG20_24165 [Acidobacteriales bacterium]|nr:hypothetical protein [Terriglobales bacterium]